MNANPVPEPGRPLNDDELRQARATWETAMMELPAELAWEPTAEHDVAMHILGLYPCVYPLTLAELDVEADRIRRR
jgi:hypothetical protein